MSIYFKALASALFLSTAVLGAAVDSSENLQKRAQLEGISISFNRGNVNWTGLATQGVSFTYIAATGGYGKLDGTLVVQNADISSQATRTLISPRSSLAPEMPVSFAVLTTSPFLVSPLAHNRPTTLLPTAETGLAMTSPSRVPSKSVVGVLTSQIR